MARFSPTVLPYAGPDFSDVLAQAIGAVRQAQALKRADEDRQRRQEFQEFELARAGGRRFDTPPTTETPVDQSIFRGARVSPSPGPDVPSIFRGQSLGIGGGGRPTLDYRPGDSAPTDLAAQLGEARSIVTAGRSPLPGQFVPGVGFAPALSTIPTEPAVIRRPDPRYEHVAGNLYYDTQDNPEVRAERREIAREERADARSRATEDRRRAAALEDRAYADRRQDEQRSILAGEFAALRDRRGRPRYTMEEADLLARGAPIGAIENPTPEEELQDYLRKQDALYAARARHGIGLSGRASGVSATQELVAARQVALQAAAAVNRIQRDAFDDEASYQEAVARTLARYGYDSPEDLGGDLRRFRIGASGGGGVPARRSTPAGPFNLDQTFEDTLSGTSNPPRKSMQERIVELKAAGVSKDRAREILRREGYQF